MGTKRIAVITPTFLPYRGGMCVVAEQDASNLCALGHEVDVLSPTGEHSETQPYNIKKISAWLRYGNGAFVPTVFFACRNYDLVILHYPFFGGAEVIALAKCFKQMKNLVVYYHMDVVGQGAWTAFFRLYGWLVRPNIIKNADKILVTSFDYARSSSLSKKALSSPEFFRELPPAVDVNRFFPGQKSPELLKRYGINNDKPVVVFVGGLDKAHYFKGINILLKALATDLLFDMQAVIVGGGSLLKEYKDTAEQLGITERVKFTGPVSDDELPAHYRLGDVFAFPSLDKSEAFGIAALEAMSCGVPVVASDLPGVRTIVREGETGFLVRPNSVSALSVKLNEMTADKHRRLMMSENGRQMAIKEYSDLRRIEKWDRLIKEIFN